MLASTSSAPAQPAVLRRLLLTLLAALACLLLGAPAALAGSPATVTVRVLGPAPNYEALTPPTEVTTTTTPVTKEGGSCSGTSAAGALELATKADWSGTWDTEFNDYEVIGIDGLNFPFETGSPANYYWSIWLGSTYEEAGICEIELEAGDQVLFVPYCYGPSCPPEPSGLLGIEAPALTDAGQPVALTVVRYGPKGETTPLAGVTVQAKAGANVPAGTSAPTSAPTNSEGRTTLSFSGGGSYTLRATAPAGESAPAVPGEASIEVTASACACGGPYSGSTQEVTSTKSSPPSTPYTGPYALVASATGVTEGHVYSRRDAPRTLSGKVSAQDSSVTSIALRLRRSYRGHCWAYDGSRARLRRAACGQGGFFKVASGGDSFSYLLPARLPPGRYVLDIKATDAAGSQTALDRGSSRIVFYVK
jgi:hypothetical protein